MSTFNNENTLFIYGCDHIFSYHRYNKKVGYYIFRCDKCDQRAISSHNEWDRNYEHGKTPIQPNTETREQIATPTDKTLLEIIIERKYFEWRSQYAKNWQRYTFQTGTSDLQIKRAVRSYKAMGKRIR